MLTIVGQGLAGSLAGLTLERRGQSFRVVDLGSGSTASRAAAGLYNPLTGPRFSQTRENWDQVTPFYHDVEQFLGVPLVHPLPLVRPLEGSKVQREDFPRSAPGWSAALRPTQGSETPLVEIRGGGWVDITALLDAVRSRWLRSGLLEERLFGPAEGQGQNVLWCGGLGGFQDPRWNKVAGVVGAWQPVRGDVLTVKIPGLGLKEAKLGKRFLLPLGHDVYRWGATHESDVAAMEYRESARTLLESELGVEIEGAEFQVIHHRWGIRPASRLGHPLVVAHPDESGWTLFNGFGGHGVSQIPLWLRRLEV